MTPRLLCVLLLCAAALPFGACKKKAPPGPVVKVFVDDVAVAPEVRAPAEPVVLATLLPEAAKDPATWRRIEAATPDGRFLDVRRPFEAYGGGETRLYVERGKAVIAVFRPVKEGLSPQVAAIARQPAISLGGITEIRIRTKEAPVPEHPATPALEISVTGEGPEPIAMEKLQALPEKKGERQQQRGWALADVLGLRVPVASVESVEVSGAEGKPVTIDHATLTDPKHALILKLNRKGELVLHDWKAGESNAALEVRQVQRMRVERRKSK